MGVRRMLPLLLVALVVCEATHGRAAVVHAGPPVYLEIEVHEKRVELFVQGEQAVINPWIGLPAPAKDAPLPAAKVVLVGEDAAKADRAIAALLADHDPITIGGERVEPTIGDVVIRGDLAATYQLPAISFSLSYPCRGTPRQIRLVWKLFEGALWAEKQALPVVIRSFGHTDMHFLKPAEPEFVWHRAMVKPSKRRVVESVGTAPEPPTFPLVPVVIVVLLLGSLPVLRGKSIGAPAIAAVWIGGVAVGAVLWDAVRLPVPWEYRVPVPPEGEAVALFEKLHRNVYAAFDARSEDEIYDLLAMSVDVRLLDELYGQVYESLVMRGQGGAVCEIEKVDVLGREALVDLVDEVKDDDAPRFLVAWKWKVHGLVTHWGHQHRRVNEYEANYTVRHDGSSWKIADIDVVEHSRVDTDG